MEKIITPEERIKRAEEIYYQRKLKENTRLSTASVNIGKKNKISLGRKMIFQICICVCVYIFILVIKDNENTFSKNTMNTISDMLGYEVNLVKIYNNCVKNIQENEFFKSMVNGKINNTNIENKDLPDDNLEENVTDSENANNIEENVIIEDNNSINQESNDGVGGADISQEQQNIQNKSQMEIDADYIKEKFNFIKPVNGYVTSGFGDREPTEIISAFHQGIDIGATQGTPIYAAVEGTVIASSYASEYGNYIKVQNEDVVTVYAHCSELNVSSGDIVAQNQVIGKVGATRKSNRTTFTF